MEGYVAIGTSQRTDLKCNKERQTSKNYWARLVRKQGNNINLVFNWTSRVYESHYWKATFCGGRYLIGPSEAEMHVNYEAVGLKHVFCNADTTTFTSLNCFILPNCIPHSTLCRESVQK